VDITLGGVLVSEEYGNDLITLSDDEGNEFVLEHLDTIEIDGQFYLAFLPTDIDEEDENYGIVILKTVEEDGEDILVELDSDDELDFVFERFTERLSDEDDE